ncbi:MAG: hypothetical protein RBT03_07675 [Kiritimatiellia bacterium]|jgi:hypothetical protein|nr:hypothetical protein [Kiritimatiellia bacterium]
MKRWQTAMSIAIGLSWSAGAAAQTPVTHAQLQAVNGDGYRAWVETLPFTIQGVIVNDPEEMLDISFNPEATTTPTGGQYQMFIQGVAEGDRGGTALYMGQRSKLGDHYAEPTWTSEVQRVMVDSNGRKFRKGDHVEVRARKALFYNGKLNINEAHRTTVSNNFDITLVQANVGLPLAEAITLADIKNADDSAIFDATRATGGEHWQGMRVRLDGIRLADTNGWGKTNWEDRVCTAVDDTGRSLLLRLPRTDLGPVQATSTWFSAVGILNQEGSWTNGYELFVQEIGPELKVGAGMTGGTSVVFPEDYDGYVVQYSDGGPGTWTNLDATPVRMIVVEDDAASPNRSYRLRRVD